jgi:6-pyruvoyltetrahydropterin/6-carboxytetrahydropterin synthase
MVYRSSKTISDLPCSHRRHLHNGHCAWVHGYSRSFEFWFEADSLDEMGFVVDFGGLKWLSEWLHENYDHTLLVDASDPLLEMFRELETRGGCKLVTYENVGMEGSAEYVGNYVKGKLRELYGDRVRLVSVECRENGKNSGGIWY